MMFSDIRVTFPSGNTGDMIKKAFPICPSVLAGFSGSVAIGFSLIESLKSHVAKMPKPSTAQPFYNPAEFARTWRSTAASVFDSFPSAEKAIGSRLIVVGLSPKQPRFIGVAKKVVPHPEFRSVILITLSGPSFRPKFHATRLSHSVVQIGSGSNVQKYADAIAGQFNGAASYPMLEQLGKTNQLAPYLGITITELIESFPESSVSHNFHILLARYHGCVQSNNDRGGPKPLTMPDVASNYPEFKQKCKELGIAAEASAC